MTSDERGAAGRPEGLRRHEEPVYGYAITVPAVFVALMNTVDPLARLMRQLDDKELDEESRLTGSWPVGFADPEVVGPVGDDHQEPLRLLEFDVLTRPDALSDAQLASMRDVVRDALPEALASRGLAGFDLLEVREREAGAAGGARVRVRVGRPQRQRRAARPGARRLGADGDGGLSGLLPLSRRGVGGLAARARGDPRVVRAHRAPGARVAALPGGLKAALRRPASSSSRRSLPTLVIPRSSRLRAGTSRRQGRRRGGATW